MQDVRCTHARVSTTVALDGPNTPSFLLPSREGLAYLPPDIILLKNSTLWSAR